MRPVGEVCQLRFVAMTSATLTILEGVVSMLMVEEVCPVQLEWTAGV